MTPGPDPLVAGPQRWLRPLALFVAAGAALYLGAIVASGAAPSADAIGRLGWPLAIGGTAVASVAYLLRFARWQWLMRRLQIRLPLLFNLRIYLAGLSLTSSPGKLGETIRSALLYDRGVPVAASLGAFLADRAGDLIGVAALGALAGMISGQRSTVLELLALALGLASAALAWAVRHRMLSRLAYAGRRWPRTLRRWLMRALSPASAWASLWGRWHFLGYALIAALAYGVQALVFAAYVSSLGAEVGAAACVMIFVNAMLLGAASMVPGGLGATEAALVYQLTAAGMPVADAVAAAIALRLSTLWFAILLGVLALLTFSRRGAGGTQR